MADVTGEAINWEVLEMAANNAQNEVPLEDRLNKLQALIEGGQVRRIGTNIVNRLAFTDEGDEETIAEVANYSILSGNTDIDPASRVDNSYIYCTSVDGVSTVSDSTITFSNVKDSAVAKSRIEASTLVDSTVNVSTVSRDSHLQHTIVAASELTNAGMVGMEVNNSTIKDVTITDGILDRNGGKGKLLVEDALIEVPRDFVPFDTAIGTGETVYGYRKVGGNMHIVAGCHDFESPEAMLDYARDNPPEYDGIAEPIKAIYLQQIEAAAAFLTATKEARDLEKAEAAVTDN